MAAFRFRNLSKITTLFKPVSVSVSNSTQIAASFISSRGIASKLFVGGLSYHTSEEALSQAFSQHGQVIEATIITDRESDRSKGFGFVSYASEAEAEKAIAEMNGKPLNGRVIFVDYARPRSGSRYSDMPIARGPPEPQQEN